MEYKVKVSPTAKQKSDCLVFGVFESEQLTPAGEKFDAAHDGYLSKMLQRAAMSGKPGQQLLLLATPAAGIERILLIGCGKADSLDATRYRKIIAHTGQALATSGARNAVLYLTELPVAERDLNWAIRQAVEQLESSRYRFTRMKSKADDDDSKLRKLTLIVGARSQVAAAEQAVDEARAIAAGTALAKDLGNLPGNVCTPGYLAEQAESLAKHYKKLKVEVLDEAELKKLGMGAFVAVAKGSSESGKLIVFEYRNGPKKQAPVALVGKGITFDTGGISIKPSAAMDEMKFDMCGAASVFGTLKACAELDLPLNVVGIVAAAENMPSGKAIKPGDIVTTLSGKTVEILNTDAEGRLVLCDALTYCERFEPAAVIDIATLTGACVIALGKHPHGLFSNNQALADDLLSAGKTAADQAWQMPVWEEYQEGLNSNFADVANVGGREGGAITAACFLARFTKDLRWAHLDIAGTAWLSGSQKGSSGRPVPLLTQYLLDRVAADNE